MAESIAKFFLDQQFEPIVKSLDDSKVDASVTASCDWFFTLHSTYRYSNSQQPLKLIEAICVAFYSAKTPF